MRTMNSKKMWKEALTAHRKVSWHFLGMTDENLTQNDRTDIKIRMSAYHSTAMFDE
jgi:hypothetical protein